MTEFTVVLEDPVMRDLEAAYARIAGDSPRAADKWYAECYAAIRSLSESPKRCPIAPESKLVDTEIRHLIHGSYRILFSVHIDEVRVLHVRHAARRPGL